MATAVLEPMAKYVPLITLCDAISPRLGAMVSCGLPAAEGSERCQEHIDRKRNVGV